MPGNMTGKNGPGTSKQLVFLFFFFFLGGGGRRQGEVGRGKLVDGGRNGSRFLRHFDTT